MLVNSQVNVVELHKSLMHHARLTGITDQGFLVSSTGRINLRPDTVAYAGRDVDQQSGQSGGASQVLDAPRPPDWHH